MNSPNLSFRSRLLNGETLIGSIVTLAASETAEIMARAGFDWLFIDFEHAALDLESVQKIHIAASPHTPCVVRVPAVEEAWIKKCLDLGADGLIIPQIRTAEEAARVVRFAKYPPMGQRGVGLGRAHGYGPDFSDYVASANLDTAIILQAEHIDAVRNIEAIVAVEGIDSIFIGPFDLSASMGKLGQVQHPEVVEAIETVQKACQRAGMPLGFFGMTPDDVKPYMAKGFTLITVGVDVSYLAGGVRAAVAALRQRKTNA
jgi:2-dehydro-3-deoxyglucarate aldolase/4-hydroxy-2-oxoheptanedioate aldolase